MDELEQKEQRTQKQAVKFLRSVTLNISSSPVLQYLLIISKCSFLCQQPYIYNIAKIYAYVDVGMEDIDIEDIEAKTQKMKLWFDWHKPISCN